MGCGCNKRRTTQTFVLKMPDGKTATYSTRLEAEAANIRAGGDGTVRRS